MSKAERVFRRPAPVRGLAVGLLVAGCWLTPVRALQLVDAPAQPARAARVQLALETYHLLDAYPDRTFQGERPFTRYELADALGRALTYLQAKFKLSLPEDPRLNMVFESYLAPAGDIPPRIWAGASLRRVLGYGLMGGTADLRFQGGAKVSRYELAMTLSQLLDWLQIQPLALEHSQPSDLSGEAVAAGAVLKLVDAGILELEGRRFNGLRVATRYELAEALVKLLQQVDLVARQRPLTPRQITPQPLPKTPSGREFTRYHAHPTS